MGRDKIKSSSLHRVHEEHVEPLPPATPGGGRTPFEVLVQELLTDQVADAFMEVLDPHGVGVVIEAYHLCMMMRGVEKQNSKTVTSALRGALLEDAKTRDEFLRLVHGGRGLE